MLTIKTDVFTCNISFSVEVFMPSMELLDRQGSEKQNLLCVIHTNPPVICCKVNDRTNSDSN